jgi:DNA helicase-2/ATP-dependent DNA helicase PcrA
VPAASRETWKGLLELVRTLTANAAVDVPAQVNLVRKFYEPLLEDRYDNASPRKRDLEQLEQMAARFPDRQAMLTQVTLDPPESTEDYAGPPLLDEDYLILSTIHSAKGLEWDSVYVIHAADGNIPSDMATKSEAEIEEELRLFYVALTRAQRFLCVCHPQRYYHSNRGGFSDRHSYAQLTRFIPADIKPCFACGLASDSQEGVSDMVPDTTAEATRKIRDDIQSMWS